MGTMSRRSWTIAGVLLDAASYLVLAAGVVVVPDPIKPLTAVALALVIRRLFLQGHEAGHGRLLASRRANEAVGRLLLLPAYTSYRLWDLAHNRTHHAFTRFKALDYMWRPMSPAKFRVVSPWRRALERAYRTGLGHGLYYFVEIYCRKLIVPSPRFVPERRAVYWADTLAVAGFVLFQVGAYVAAAAATGQGIVWVLFTAMVLPFALWNVLAGSASFVRHTRPEIAWFDDIDEWRAAKPQLLDSVRVTPAAFVDAVRRCKLYDYKSHRWLDFKGRITAEIRPRNR